MIYGKKTTPATAATRSMLRFFSSFHAHNRFCSFNFSDYFVFFLPNFIVGRVIKQTNRFSENLFPRYVTKSNEIDSDMTMMMMFLLLLFCWPHSRTETAAISRTRSTFPLWQLQSYAYHGRSLCDITARSLNNTNTIVLDGNEQKWQFLKRG